MRPLTDTELAAMRAAQVSTMSDRCVILRWSGSADDLGQVVASWTPDAEETRCGFGWAQRHEVADGDKTVVRGAMTLRLPHGTRLDPRDRVRITARFGAAEADPVTYDVDGTPAVGPSGLVVRLTRATL